LTPILTHDLAERLEMALAEAAAARLAGVAALEGNPLGIETRTFGHVAAARVKNNLAHYHYFSGPRGLRAGDDQLVAPIVDWYEEASLHVRLAPMFVDEALLRALAAAGLRQTSFMSTMYGLIRPGHIGDIEIREDRTAMSHLWTTAPLEQRLMQAEFEQGWRCYVAILDGQPVAYGALYTATNRVAVCAAAATREQFRGRGCQTALLNWRLRVAAEHGCELAAIQASPGSGSQRNMQRLGLQLAWTGVTWTR
jgi:GNAT superfamily N-acetyltransferase